jgi:serine protease Do
MKRRYGTPTLLAFVVLAVGLLTALWPAPVAQAAGLLAQLETEIQKLAADLSQSVVTVRAIRVQDDRTELREVYVGTGVVFDSGWVITTPSVVASGVSYSIEAPGQVPVPAELVEYNQEGQLAVFRAPSLIAPSAEFDTSAALLPGQMLLVMGNAFGVQGAVSWGIAAGERGDGTWQVGVSISPGASGSPVINTSGRVVGLIAAALSDMEMPTAPMFGGHAAVMVPMDRSMRLAKRVMAQGSVGRAFLGVRPETVEPNLARALGLSHGVLIGAVSFGSPAYSAGLRSGDVIIEIDHQPVVHEQGLRMALAEHCPGEEVNLVVVRNSQISQMQVRLGQVPEVLPDRPAAASFPQSALSSRNIPATDTSGSLESEIRLLEQRLQQLKAEPDGP